MAPFANNYQNRSKTRQVMTKMKMCSMTYSALCGAEAQLQLKKFSLYHVYIIQRKIESHNMMWTRHRVK